MKDIGLLEDIIKYLKINSEFIKSLPPTLKINVDKLKELQVLHDRIVEKLSIELRKCLEK